jgi:hypothetical protein
MIKFKEKAGPKVKPAEPLVKDGNENKEQKNAPCKRRKIKRSEKHLPNCF